MTSFEELLPGYLGRQRWFGGEKPDKVAVLEDRELAPRLRWMIVDAEGARYQLFVAERPEQDHPDFLHGHDDAVLGIADGKLHYDAVLDAELAFAILATVSATEHAELVRPMGAEQSNTSLVFDDRIILKLFRRVHDGPNPDVEVTSALASRGFENVAAPLAVWQSDGIDLAILQPFLLGGADGWALALTSLRDLYATRCDPAECGGDFAGEASRLGEVTARLHLAMADAFGSQRAKPGPWAGAMREQLARLSRGAPWEALAAAVFEEFGRRRDVGASIRIHGDYHLGQVMRADSGWVVLDFEGEPLRPIEERRLPSSPLKDVAGMVRSFDYAAQVARRDWPEYERADLDELADAWVRRNRQAFLEGYLSREGVDQLLPGNMRSTLGVLAAWELDKAVYEVGYERDHRPDWVEIPESAINRLLLGR